jgi:hypothetical protein
MEIKFKFIDDKNINITCEDKIIGRIKTPSGTMGDEPNAIQVCGFDKVFDYMGCGIFGDGKGNAKKDIQLLFNKDSEMDYKVGEMVLKDGCCYKCFYKKDNCKCNEFKLNLKHEEIIKEEIIKNLR